MGIAVFALAPLLVAQANHRILLERPTLVSEEGVLLGNGDLSVSVYQTADAIIWRFGKGDVWDRRLDLSENPKPAHIDEVIRGVEVEGWKCPPYGGKVEATKAPAADPKRMREICKGVSPSDVNYPYPCPKPVGELALHFPPDLPGMTVRQELVIEEAKLVIECSWASGVKLRLESFVPPKPNVLAVRWKLENWNDNTRMGRDRSPVWFSLYRWADPTAQAFAARQYSDNRVGAVKNWTSPKITPLPPPGVRGDDGILTIEQTFYPDPLFKDGFRYLLTPFVSTGVALESLDTASLHEAHVHILPKQDATEGQLLVAVATSNDAGGPLEELKRIRRQIGGKLENAVGQMEKENFASASNFWSRSSVSISDPLLENLWYETFHARRCAYRGGTVPPGLFLPSTVRDYSHWHGDYHMNYNLQEPFFGDYTANHLDLADAYSDVINFFLPIGRKIAKDYYGGRGVFIQLSGYPILAEDDPIGVVPMGRMAYMTGWAMTQYWWRYLYTLDKEWLKTTGYPVIRDCALFYLDFLKKGKDGLYHAFPSNMEEYGFTGNSKDLTDRYQVMRHMRYCLRAAIRASEALGVDEALRGQWRERLDHAAGDDGKPPLALSGLEKECQEANTPEFGDGRPYKSQPAWKGETPSGGLGWYFGQTPWRLMASLRDGSFVAERDLPVFRRKIEAWRRPNGLIWGMAVANYGRSGAWTESLGVCAPLQEMMLQSWDGALRVFPAWPKGLAARFDGFRAEGAFRVSASWADGQVKSLTVWSEKGAPCKIYPPCQKGIRVADSSGNEIPVAHDGYGRAEFATTPGCEYRLTCLY
jgi:hypothetical protein